MQKRPRVRPAARPYVVLAAVALALGAGQLLRRQLGIEWSAESIQATVKGFGIWAELGFVALVLFRQLLALPSVLILTTAGLLFGAQLGTLLGGLAMALNACLLYTTARFMGRDQVLSLIHRKWPDFEVRAQAAGPPFIALMTGHPFGMLTPFHFAAGVTGISAPTFVAAVLPTSLIRAACYSLLGAYILNPGSTGFWVAMLVLGAAALLPMAHPAVRERLLTAVRPLQAATPVAAGGRATADADSEAPKAST